MINSSLVVWTIVKPSNRAHNNNLMYQVTPLVMSTCVSICSFGRYLAFGCKESSPKMLNANDCDIHCLVTVYSKVGYSYILHTVGGKNLERRIELF